MVENLRAVSMGNVRQEVKISAGSFGDEGRCSFAVQAANWMDSIMGYVPSGYPPCIPSFGEVYETLKKVASGRTVSNIHARGSKPILDFNYGNQDILRVILVGSSQLGLGTP